jgi:putative transposase
MVAQQFIDDGYPVSNVLKILRLPRSSYYYKPAGTAGKGRTCSTHTLTGDGIYVSNEVVIEHIRKILSREFVDYGYLKVTHALHQQYKYRINKKKVYRLMKQAELLYKRLARVKGNRLWVNELVPQPQGHFSYLEFDIKYIWIAGERRNALVLSVIDVFSRWVLGQLISYSVRKEDVVELFDQIFAIYPMPLRIYVRNDNGSQMESRLVQQYFADMEITQEFTRPATPEQNAHIESYHSIIERVICARYEFEDLSEAIDTFERWLDFYNYERIHSGINYLSPYNYLLSMGIDMVKEMELKKALATEPPIEDLNRNTVQYLGG